MDNQNGNENMGFENEMAEILQSFLVETKEIFEQLGQDLLLLEKDNSNPALLNTIFRAVHTVKGTSSFLGLEKLTSLAHVFEDVLNKLRKGEIALASQQMDIMFEAFDTMKLLVAKIDQNDGSETEVVEISEKLKRMAQQTYSSEKKGIENLPAEITIANLKESDVNPSKFSDHIKGINSVEEASPRESVAEAKAMQKQTDTTIRVDVQRLDHLMNLVGELVLGRNRLNQISEELNEKYEGTKTAKDFADTYTQIDFITTELQMAVMKTRMVPIAKVFNRIPRLVRDLSKEMNKDVELLMSGEETELDKSIIEELNDPLVHIIRNATDHGIENPDVRLKMGKPQRGTIRLKAAHEGNHIIISIEDDGKGMDPEKLKQKGIEKGMISIAEAQEMSAREAFNLIFAPGFSTSEKVTNISGRGVGMDVVRTNISNLKGIIEIDSTVGVGSKFVIKLPLTLAIVQALLVQVGKDVLSIPLASVLEVRRVNDDEIETVNKKEVIRLRNAVLPLTRVSYLMGISTGENESKWHYVVVVGLGSQRLGIVVDSLLGQKEVVIKSLGGYLGTVPGIAGSTILGDGRVIMIVDVSELMKICNN
jgi:two-component system, chemotaxis family, sensor kinase CheA